MWTVYDYKGDIVAYTDSEEDAKFLAECYDGHYEYEE